MVAGNLAGNLAGGVAGNLAGQGLALDQVDVTNLRMALSLHRLLRSSYAGPLFRVRRSSDSTEQDISPVGGVYDEASLDAFCTGADGFLVTAYDQGAAGRNLTQGTAASQAKIYDSVSGSNLQGGFLAATLTGTQGVERADALGLGGSDPGLDCFHVAKVPSASSFRAWNLGTATPYHAHQYDTGDKSLRHGNGARVFDSVLDETVVHSVSSRVTSGDTYADHLMWSGTTAMTEQSVINGTNTLSPLGGTSTKWGLQALTHEGIELIIFGSTSGNALSLADANALRANLVGYYG